MNSKPSNAANQPCDHFVRGIRLVILFFSVLYIYTQQTLLTRRHLPIEKIDVHRYAFLVLQQTIRPVFPFTDQHFWQFRLSPKDEHAADSFLVNLIRI